MTCLLAYAGCGAAGSPPPDPPPTSSTSPSPTSPRPSSPSPTSVPVDGVTLRQLGFTHGPASFSMPRSATYLTTGDQPNGVTLVTSEPAPAELVGYLTGSLPAGGFTITSRSALGPTLTFEGQGWTGSFTATGSTSAIILRPL